MSTIGERIKELRISKRKTLDDLASIAKTTRQTIYKYENNIITNIPSDKIEKLSNYLGTTPGYLMGWDEPSEPVSITDRLNKYINQDSLSEISDATGISERKIKMWLLGEKEPNMGQVKKLAEYLDVKISAIIGEGYKETKGVSIPVLGKVIAGIPIEAIEDIIDYEEIDAEMAKSGEYFGLQISGDSMEPRFIQGDVVIVKKQTSIESGQIAIVRVNGHDATVKKVLINDGGITLVPFNNAYDPIFYSKKQIQELPVEIAGKVVELRGKF